MAATAPISSPTTSAVAKSPMNDAFTLVIHGGAGAIRRDTPAEHAQQYRVALADVLRIGYDVLAKGGTALDGVEAAVRALEDCPLFNAGKGAVYTHTSTHELDASIMEGIGRRAGAICGVRHIEHPITLARAVMEHSDHVMLAGDGAEQFAVTRNIPLVANTIFDTEERLAALKRVQHTMRMELDHTGTTPALVPTTATSVDTKKEDDKSSTSVATATTTTTNNTHKFGTVGCVAVDRYGNVAAATSTGGMTNKRWGRIGDSPVIGAGTYADNNTAAISCTGYGEYFIRASVAYDITARMRYGHRSLTDAAADAVASWQPTWGVDFEGGLIAVDRHGHVAMPFNSEGMYRGVITNHDTRAVGGRVAIWTEPLAPVPVPGSELTPPAAH